MALDPRIALAIRAPNAGQAFSNALTNIKNIDSIQQQRLENPLSIDRMGLNNQLMQQRFDANQKNQQAVDNQSKAKSIAFGSAEILPFLENGDFDGAQSVLLRRKQDLEKHGVATETTDEALSLLKTNPALLKQRAAQGVQLGQKLGFFSGQTGLTGKQRERNSLLNTLNDPSASEEAKASAEIALGLKARKVGASAKTVDVGGVPHIFDPVKKTFIPAVVGGENVTSESVGESKATIIEAEKRGEGRAKTATTAINTGIKAITGISKNLLNIDKAISAIDKGAKTGVIESNFLPSIKAATINLNQIQSDLALDVVGATTFGALSAGELNLARNTALPTNLDEADLKIWLQEKGKAQRKLRDYYNEQIQFLNNGGSVPEFLAEKQARIENSERVIQSQEDQGVIMQDANGNRARVFKDGRFEEL